MGYAVAQLGHCTTSRKVAGSVPCGVIGIFHWRNLSGLTMALGSTQFLTETSTRGISWGCKGGRCLGLTTLPPSYADCLEILEASASWTPKGLSRPLIRDLYCFRYNRLLAYNVLRQETPPCCVTSSFMTVHKGAPLVLNFRYMHPGHIFTPHLF
jgi:hypothetical protein